MPKQSRTSDLLFQARKSAGFALIATIWALGLMTLLATAAIVGARYRTMDSATMSAAFRAALAADAAIDVAIAALLQHPEALQTTSARFPVRCSLPGGDEVYITLEDEAGKIDLNTARPHLITQLISKLGGSAADAARITDRIVQFRQGSGRPGPTPAGIFSPPQKTLAADRKFLSTLQLDQAVDIPKPLFRAIFPFITVRSGQVEPSVSATSSKLRSLLNLPAVNSTQAPNPPKRLAFTIRADALTNDGARFIREGIVSFGGVQLFEIHEWRRGDIDRFNQRPLRMTGAATACISR